MSDARKPDANTLALEALYVCRPDGFDAFKCSEIPSEEILETLGLVRVEWRAVKCYPPVCPVNGAEFGDEPYYKRIPHRPDGTRLRLA